MKNHYRSRECDLVIAQKGIFALFFTRSAQSNQRESEAQKSSTAQVITHHQWAVEGSNRKSSVNSTARKTTPLCTPPSGSTPEALGTQSEAVFSTRLGIRGRETGPESRVLSGFSVPPPPPFLTASPSRFLYTGFCSSDEDLSDRRVRRG